MTTSSNQNIIDVYFEIDVPIEVRAKAVVEAGQVHVIDAYIVNELGGTYARNLGEVGYLKVLNRVAVEARDEDAARREDFDARR